MGEEIYTARIEQIRYDTRFGCRRVLLIDVRKNGEKWRNHLWIKPRSKEMHKYKRGVNISFTAKEYFYIDIETNEPTKRGLQHIRNLKYGN